MGVKFFARLKLIGGFIVSVNLQLERDAEGNYLIGNAENLFAFAAYVNAGGDTSGKTFTLTNDIDLSGKWTPVGQEGKLFDGTFDGNNHTISNITVTVTADDKAGFFGFIGSDASIKNLKLNNVNVSGCDDVGGLVGNSTGRAGENIINCTVTGSVSGNECVGGLVGDNYGHPILNCNVNVTVSGNRRVGGLVGLNLGKISDCKVDGSIKGDSHVGGATGENVGCNKNITVAASVIGKSCVGGITGLCGDFGDVYFCTVTGSVSGEKSVGGIIGLNDGYGHSCTVTGSVTGKEKVGTFVGFNDEGTFKTEGSLG